MRRSPPSSCAATSSTTRGWFSGRFELLAWLASIISRAGKPGLGEQLARGRDVLGVVVRRLAAAQDHVAVGVAGRRRHRRLTFLGHGQEMMRMRRRTDGIDGDLDVAVGAVLEAHGARQPDASSRWT